MNERFHRLSESGECCAAQGHWGQEVGHMVAKSNSKRVATYGRKIIDKDHLTSKSADAHVYARRYQESSTIFSGE